MKQAYKKYNAEKFAQELDFINWVKHNSNNELWKKFIAENPELINEIVIAKSIVNSLKFSKRNSFVVPSEEIFSKLNAEFDKSKSPLIKFRLNTIIRYAAVIALIVSVSITSYFFYNKPSNENIEFSDLNFSQSNTDKIQLVLADGKKIDLPTKSKQIQVNSKTSSIIVDNKNTIDNTIDNASSNQFNEVSTPYGKRLNVILSDGTSVWLNSGSKLIFPQHFDGKNRKVFLLGEAYFKVSKDKKHPFVVNANQLNVSVLGTEFNINNRTANKNLEVVLVEGSVMINSNLIKNKNLKLVPAQKIVFDKFTNEVIVISDINVDFYTSWKDGYIIFEKQNIRNVLNILSQYYNVHFVVDSQIDINRNITGKLELKDSFNEVMQVMSDLALINYTITGNNIEITNFKGK